MNEGLILAVSWPILGLATFVIYFGAIGAKARQRWTQEGVGILMFVTTAMWPIALLAALTGVARESAEKELDPCGLERTV